MEPFRVFHEAGIAALMSMAMATVPMWIGIAYAIRPTESKLALMRPLALAGLFAGITGSLLGLVNMLTYVASTGGALTSPNALAGLSESLVTSVIGFGSLTVGWLCVALGLRRQA